MCVYTDTNEAITPVLKISLADETMRVGSTLITTIGFLTLDCLAATTDDNQICF